MRISVVWSKMVAELKLLDSQILLTQESTQKFDHQIQHCRREIWNALKIVYIASDGIKYGTNIAIAFVSWLYY